jgi:hypothetical protein
MSKKQSLTKNWSSAKSVGGLEPDTREYRRAMERARKKALKKGKKVPS